MRDRTTALRVTVPWRQVFDLQTKALPLQQSGKAAPPTHPPAGWKAGVNARQKVSGVFASCAVQRGSCQENMHRYSKRRASGFARLTSQLRQRAGVLAVHAKAAPAAMVPHLQALASQTQQLWEAGLLRPGERCVLSETLVIAAAGSTPDIQKQARRVVPPTPRTSLRRNGSDNESLCSSMLCWPCWTHWRWHGFVQLRGTADAPVPHVAGGGVGAGADPGSLDQPGLAAPSGDAERVLRALRQHHGGCGRPGRGAQKLFAMVGVPARERLCSSKSSRFKATLRTRCCVNHCGHATAHTVIDRKSLTEPDERVGQAGGGMERQALYHDVHLLERTLRSFAQPAGASPLEHPISPHLPWMLPVLLQVRLE